MSRSFPRSFSNVFDKRNLEEMRDEPFASRRKRPHLKSRNGCLNCKRRRVKCDENYPSCQRCTKRGDTCSRSPRERLVSRSDTTDSPRLSTSSLSLLSPTMKERSIDLEDMKLFHHFQTFTCRTLPIIAPVWKEAVNLAFQHEYLMHAVLCVSARHLAFLYPKSNRYTTLSRKHLAPALRLFREELCDQSIKDNQDALICTSALVYYEAWSSPDILSSDPSEETSSDRSLYHAQGDQLLTLANGMRYVFSFSKMVKRCVTSPLGQKGTSVFEKQLTHRPIKVIENTSKFLGLDPFFHECFLATFYNQPESILDPDRCQLPPLPDISLSPDLCPTDYINPTLSASQTCRHDAYMSVARRLSILLSLLPNNEEGMRSENKEEASILNSQAGLLSDVSRVVYSFYLVLHPAFIDMLFENDLRALLLMYHFYRMIVILLPRQDCWWASRRAEVMQRSLARRLWGRI